MREQLPTILKMEPTKLQNWTDDAPFLTLSSFLLYVSLSCPVFILFFLFPLSHASIEKSYHTVDNMTLPIPCLWKTVLNSQMCAHTNTFTAASKHRCTNKPRQQSCRIRASR